MKNQEPMGLTTTQAPFIEKARQQGELFIRQPYELYNEDNQEAWQKLYQLLSPRWEKIYFGLFSYKHVQECTRS